MSLQARKGGPCRWPWAAFITDGPSVGMRVSEWMATKRDTVAWIAGHEHLPWQHLVHDLPDAASAATPIVTVPTVSVERREATVASLERELALYRDVLLYVDGSAMLVIAAKERRKAREETAA